MAVDPKEGKLLYHLTPLENLTGIIARGLLPRKQLKDFRNIASPEILAERTKYSLEDFVPFHFLTRTPFCGIVQKSHAELDFIYLAIKREEAKNLNFKIIPIHPLSFHDKPLDWETGFNKINWDLMALRDYQNHECKEVCMAEAICDGVLEISKIAYIYTKNEQIKNQVLKLLREHGLLRIIVDVNPYMFVGND